MKRKRKTMPPLERVQRDLESGMSNLDMEEAYGVNLSTITHFLSKHGLRRSPKPVMPTPEQLLECLNAKMTLYAMAKHFRLSQDTIRRQIDKGQLRAQVEVRKAPEPIETTRPTAGPTKIVNGLGISLPRIPTIHGHFEVRA